MFRQFIIRIKKMLKTEKKGQNGTDPLLLEENPPESLKSALNRKIEAGINPREWKSDQPIPVYNSKGELIEERKI